MAGRWFTVTDGAEHSFPTPFAAGMSLDERNVAGTVETDDPHGRRVVLWRRSTDGVWTKHNTE